MGKVIGNYLPIIFVVVRVDLLAIRRDEAYFQNSPSDTVDNAAGVCYNRKAMDTKGKFIVFEGTDGSGKSTQIRLLSQYLQEKGVPVFETHEPTASPIGEVVRACMSGSVDTDERAIALLFAADRIDHIASIKQKLEEGFTVLCDRYYFSSFAYNGGLVPLEWVIELNRPAMELLRADLTVFLDVNVEETMNRVLRRTARERYENVERQILTRKNYFEVFDRFKATEHIAIVKSEPAKEATQAAIREVVDGLFGGKS